MSLLSQVRNDYIQCIRPRAKDEASHYASGADSERVRRAALALTSNNRKHKHQWRIKPVVLEKFAARLITRLSIIKQARSFSELLAVVDEARIKGIGELTVYDTSLRIGVGQELTPLDVYLHAGTRKGAKRLNWNVRRASIPRSEITTELDGLSSSEIEDLLCHYACYFGPDALRFNPESKPQGCSLSSNLKQGC